MRISDWSSDVCSSDLGHSEQIRVLHVGALRRQEFQAGTDLGQMLDFDAGAGLGRGRPGFQFSHSSFSFVESRPLLGENGEQGRILRCTRLGSRLRSEEHTSELQSLMRNSYAVFCLKKKKYKN